MTELWQTDIFCDGKIWWGDEGDTDNLWAFVIDGKLLRQICFGTENVNGDEKLRHTNTLNPFNFF